MLQVTVVAKAGVDVTGNQVEASTTSVLVWGLVDTSQTASWASVSSSQTPSWSAVDTDQTPDWEEVA